MSVLGLSGPPPPPPPVVSERDKSDRRIILVIIVLTVVVVVGSICTIGFLWFHYSKKYTRIDTSHERLAWDPGRNGIGSTTYTNPPYGVRLTLPGNWRHAPCPIRCFITLAGHPDPASSAVDVMFWPVFTGVPTSIDTEAATIGAVYRRNAGWQETRTEAIKIDGRDARVMWFSAPQQNMTVMLTVVNKGPVTYGLVFAGAAGATGAWQAIDQALPQAIKIQ